MQEHLVGGIVFNPEACKGCGLCVETCRARARRMSTEVVNSRGIHPVQHKADKCEACGTCYYFCPELGANMIAAPRKAPGREHRYLPAA